MVKTQKQPAHEVTLEKIRKAVKALNERSSEHSDQHIRHEYSVGAIQVLLSVLGEMEIPEEEDRQTTLRELRNILDHGRVPHELQQFFTMALDEI